MSLGPPSWPEDIHRSLKYVLEKEKQSPSRAVKRGRTEEVKAVGNRLMWVACLKPGAMVSSMPGLLPRARSGNTALQQPGSESTSVAPDATEDRVVVLVVWDASSGLVGVWGSSAVKTIEI